MKLSKKSGAVLAASAALMVLGGVPNAPVANAAEEAKVKCYGVNVCKGHGACKTATNECKGMNTCKGTGFVKVTKSVCADIGGEVKG